MGTALPRKARKLAPLRLTEPPPVREHPLHRAIAHALAIELAPAGRVSADGVVWWSVDLAAYLGNMPYSHTSRGCVPGIPDVFILHKGRSHMMEIKAQDGQMSWPQRTLAAAVIGSGGRVAIASTVSAAIAALDEWQIPRARRINGL